MKHSLCSLNITKDYVNLSNIFSAVIFLNMKNVVTCVGVLVVDIHWGGLLVMIEKIFNLLFYLRSVGKYQGQLPNVDKANADPGLRDRLKIV